MRWDILYNLSEMFWRWSSFASTQEVEMHKGKFWSGVWSVAAPTYLASAVFHFLILPLNSLSILVFFVFVFSFFYGTKLFAHLKFSVFKWLSKVISWLLFLRLLIGLKYSRQFINQWESKTKPIALSTRDFSRASSELQLIARNCHCFIPLPAPVVIGRSNCFGFGFSTVIGKPLYYSEVTAHLCFGGVFALSSLIRLSLIHIWRCRRS